MFRQSFKFILILSLLLTFGLQNGMAQCDLTNMATHSDEMLCPDCLDMDDTQFDKADCLSQALLSADADCLLQDSDFAPLYQTFPDLEQTIYFEIDPQFLISHVNVNANILSAQDKPATFTIDKVKAFPPPYQSTKRFRI